jgi:hypothetical protein
MQVRSYQSHEKMPRLHCVNQIVTCRSYPVGWVEGRESKEPSHLLIFTLNDLLTAHFETETQREIQSLML